MAMLTLILLEYGVPQSEHGTNKKIHTNRRRYTQHVEDGSSTPATVRIAGLLEIGD